MAGDGREPVLARPASCARSSSTSTRARGSTAASSTSASSPACGWRTPRCSRRLHAQGARARRATGLVDGAARSTTPTGSPIPARLPAAAARRRRRARLGREDPRAGRAAARLAGRGHDGLRVPQRRHGALRRPEPEEPLTELYARADGRAAPVRGGRRRGEARAGADDLRARGRAARAGSATSPSARPPRRSRRSRSTARTSSRDTGVVDELDREAVARAAAARRGSQRSCCSRSAATTRSSPASSRRRGPVMAKGVEDTAFYRYIRLARAERGRRRPGPLRPPRRRVPRREPRARRRFPRTCSPRRRTTRSAAPTCARGSRRCRGWPPSGRSGRAAAGGCGAIRAEDVPRSADARRGVAARAGAARGVPREGAARGEAEHELGRAGRRARATRPGRVRRASTRRCRRTSSRSLHA